MSGRWPSSQRNLWRMCRRGGHQARISPLTETGSAGCAPCRRSWPTGGPRRRRTRWLAPATASATRSCGAGPPRSSRQSTAGSGLAARRRWWSTWAAGRSSVLQSWASCRLATTSCRWTCTGRWSVQRPWPRTLPPRWPWWSPRRRRPGRPLGAGFPRRCSWTAASLTLPMMVPVPAQQHPSRLSTREIQRSCSSPAAQQAGRKALCSRTVT
mmetsp:Transcript_39224/g.109110  ORF Transcript_39224/g.109110 Transcript_39224/m.109110 type:complete len:212 (+) Transcript_39224:322-957(+)